MPNIQSLSDITNAALMALRDGEGLKALELAMMLVAHPQSGTLQRLVFANALGRTNVQTLGERIKRPLEIVLGANDVDSQRMFANWYYVFRTLPLYKDFWEECDWEKIEEHLQDKFLIEGLRNLNFLDWNLERVFTKLRHDILLEYWPDGLLKTKHLPFLCALAEHCFYNEYVMEQTDEEIAAARLIAPIDPIAVAIIGCYKPLSSLTFDQKMSAVAAFRSMVKTQVTNPRLEQKIKDGFESYDMTDKVSQSVQEMYEQNPYPRWSSINLAYKQFSDIEADILLAGCGTGQTATGFASALPHCNFTGIDLSRTSLAYAVRQAEFYNLDNIEFQHLDILNAESLNQSYDYIECSGVLHHMKDPELGWKKLVSCLKEGGGMQVALYSRATRSEINSVRDYISKKRYKPEAGDIRKLRADIQRLPEGDPLKAVIQMRDFYSTSMVRDLVFHIQETSYDIPELDTMMDRLGLQFDGFKLNPGTQAAYRARFPDDPAMTNLKNWEVFESEHPDTFIGMYRIFCHKKGEIVSDSVTRIREIQA